MKIVVLAIGKMRGSEAAWCDEYCKRLRRDIVIKEMSAPKSLPAADTQKAEAELILGAISSKSFVVLLDEKGKDFTSRQFADQMGKWLEQGSAELVFVIGGADGVTSEVKQRANALLCFGHLTWAPSSGKGYVAGTTLSKPANQ